MLLVLLCLALAPPSCLPLECSFSHSHDRAGTFSSELWYWPDHVIYYRSTSNCSLDSTKTRGNFSYFGSNTSNKAGF